MANTIQWEVDKDSISTTFLCSPETRVGGIPWVVNVYKTADGEHLSVFLTKKECGSKLYTVDAEITFSLINHDDEDDTIAKKSKNIFEGDARSWGYPKFSKWATVIDEEKGFLNDNKLTVKVNFRLSNIIESRKRRRVDCTDSDEPSHDLTLVVDNKKFYVSRSYLSIISPVFHAMLFGSFDEKNEKTIELKEIDAKTPYRLEFGVLMNVIYPPYEKISDNNYAFLLKLGDYYEIDVVIDKVEQFLIESTKLTISAKLALAGQYRLVKLQIHCFNELKTVKDIIDVKKASESTGLTDAINVALLDKIVKLSN